MKLPLVSACITGIVICATIASAAETAGARKFSQAPVVVPSAEETAQADAATKKQGPITPDKPAYWIWGADNDHRYFVRKTFSGGSRAARLQATADNVMSLSINGRQVAESDNWQAPLDADVQQHLVDGENVIDVEVSNQGGPAGFVLQLALTMPDGSTRYVVTDESWQVSEKRNRNNPKPARQVVKYGGGAWGDVFAAARETTAPARDVFNTLPGFKVERLFTVPKEQLGSWVSIALDDQGRLLASDQGGIGICRITPPALGSSAETQVELLDVKISSAQGMVYAFGSLYISLNGPQPGIYRVRDTNGDDQFDEVVKLAEIRGAGEHGGHALRLAPDGKSLYLACGNHTRLPMDLKLNAPPQTMGGVRNEQLRAELPAGMTSRLMPNWDEDVLLPRQWDSNGHAAGVLAPGGYIVKTDPDCKTWEIVSVGYRNQYDLAFNADGELFSYDSDMEWDIGSPWYRPTRVTHATSGSEFGWRSGTADWPWYYADSLPPTIDIGPGSPVGVAFGYGTKFPAKYQRALYLCDWTYGTMYAIHLEPAGASYRAVKEEFLSRSPLPLTDAVVGKDGALYFTVGGRGTQSELYRVTYVGHESTAPAEYHDAQGADLRALRRKIEAYHLGAIDDPAAAAKFLTPYLGHADEHIRYAARVALERLPTSTWQEAVFSSNDPTAVINGAIGLARQAERTLRPQLLARLGALEFSKLTEAQQLGLLRAYQLVFIRLGLPEDSERLQLGAKFDALFPAASELVNRELAELMVGLASPQAASKLVAELSRTHATGEQVATQVLERNRRYASHIVAMQENPPDLQQYHYVYCLKSLKAGWTMDLRRAYFAWFERARGWAGGNSFQKFLTNIDAEAFANATDAERLAIEAAGIRKPYIPPPLPKPQGPGRDYTLADVLQAADGHMRGRSFKNGEKMYAAARCIVCHRFGGDGGATGPDLTQLAGRFNLKDLTESIVDPSKVISDQYKATIVQTDDGQVLTGRIVSEAPESITLLVDPENSSKIVTIARKSIEQMNPSPLSLMPKDLLKTLNENEVLDLLAYLLSRGIKQDAMFKN